MEKAEGVVLRFAVLFRLLLITLIVIWRYLLLPYDSSAQLNLSCLSSLSIVGHLLPLDVANRVLWPQVGATIDGSIIWDDVYFVGIAECGYDDWIQSSADALRLSILILKDSKASLLASILFCFNPASVFYSSIYSESIYALSSLCGIFYLFSDSNTVAMLLLGVSGAARSNGAINAGYFCFKSLCQSYDAITQKRTIRHAVQVIIGGVASSFYLFVPFAVFQTYRYYNICVSAASDLLSPWCKSIIPNLYGYLQSHYWGVGFLRYFQVKQLPNFLLAASILAISIASVIYYASLVQQILRSLRMKSRKASNAMPYPLGECHTKKIVSSSNNTSSSKDLKGNLMYPRQKNENKAKPSENLYKKLDSFIDVKQGYDS